MASPIYRPLDPSRDEIRLWEIRSIEPQIELSLITTTLSDELHYSALSYVWGDASDRADPGQWVRLPCDQESRSHPAHYSQVAAKACTRRPYAPSIQTVGRRDLHQPARCCRKEPRGRANASCILVCRIRPLVDGPT